MLEEGSTIGPYRIVKKIGEGGMGSVFLAQHTLLGRSAAIKVLLPALSSQKELVERFFNEARATTTVTDPGIVSVFDFGFHSDGSAYIVMELLDGESLEARMHRGRLAVVDALKLARQAASTLAAAHAHGIVHRDLKPDNLFIVRDPEAQGGERTKILDFGIAKLTSDAPDRSRTRTGTLLGTPIYMSPEQCRGAGLVDHRSDIYSLGCVVYHMICGRPPFDFEGIGEIISAHMREPAVPPSACAGVSVAIDELVMRCLAKQPEQRFQSMAELKVACEALLARISVAGAQTIAVSTLSRPMSTTLGSAASERVVTSRGSAKLWIAACGVIAAAAIAIVMTRRTPAPPVVAAPIVAIDARVPDAMVPDAPRDAAPDAPPPDAAPIDAALPVRHHVQPPPPQHPKPQGDPYDVR